jgi:hypothetical protein
VNKKITDIKNKCLLEMSCDDNDITILNTPLIEFVVCSEKINLSFQELIVEILLLCRSKENLSPALVRSALATALFMLNSRGSAVCMLEDVEKFVTSLN